MTETNNNQCTISNVDRLNCTRNGIATGISISKNNEYNSDITEKQITVTYDAIAPFESAAAGNLHEEQKQQPRDVPNVFALKNVRAKTNNSLNTGIYKYDCGLNTSRGLRNYNFFTVFLFTDAKYSTIEMTKDQNKDDQNNDIQIVEPQKRSKKPNKNTKTIFVCLCHNCEEIFTNAVAFETHYKYVFEIYRTRWRMLF